MSALVFTNKSYLGRSLCVQKHDEGFGLEVSSVGNEVAICESSECVVHFASVTFAIKRGLKWGFNR